jgi:NAD(P)-dependent dehydrogenase (short-subunit alcohol dehydrogenase family)
MSFGGAGQRVADETAVVTGAGSGLGYASAVKLAAEGARVACLDRSLESARKAADFIDQQGGEALALACDVTEPHQVEAAITHVVERFGPLHILFNNAGIAVRSPVDQESPEKWDECMAVNVRGIYLVARAAIPHMQAPASIINTASVTGLLGIRNRAAYSASKGAIISLTRNMALDYAARGIRVNCICPGFVRTPLLDPIMGDEQRLRRLTSLHPIGRLGMPEDVANAVLFLASGESAWITGIALPVDGGFTAGHALEI